MSTYTCTTETKHRFLKVFVDPDMDYFSEYSNGTAYLCDDIITNFMPNTILSVVDIDDFVILEVTRESSDKGKIYNIGFIMKAVEIMESIDSIDWVAGVMSIENTNHIIDSSDEDRAYMIADLLGVSSDMLDYWITRNQKTP